MDSIVRIPYQENSESTENNLELQKNRLTVTFNREGGYDPNCYFQRVKEICEKYVEDGIGDNYHLLSSASYGLISAPTGSGKSTFILNVIIPKAVSENAEVLILSNRIAVNRSIKRKIIKMLKKDFILEELTDKGLDKLCEFGNVTIKTYQSFFNDINCPNYKQKYYKYVIMDECHFFISDALFNNATYRCLKFIIRKFNKSIRIYMTATPDEIFPIIKKFEDVKRIEAQYQVQYINANPREFEPIYYDFNRNFEHIKTQYLRSISQLIDLIKNDKSNKKWFIFINSINLGEQIVEELGNNSVLLTANSKESSNTDNKILTQIIEEEKYDVKVLITTAVLDVGINIKDDDVKNIVLLTDDKTQFIQALGRKRCTKSDKINLFILNKELGTLSKTLNLINEKLSAFYQLVRYKKTDDISILNNLLSNTQKRRLIEDFIFLDKDGKTNYNKLALDKLKLNQKFYEKIIDRIKEGHDYAYIKEQLRWINQVELFSEDNFVGSLNISQSQANLDTFFNNNLEILVKKSEQEEFSVSFKRLINEVYGKQKNDRHDRVYGFDRINNVLDELQLPYELKSTNDSWILTRRKLNENDN